MIDLEKEIQDNEITVILCNSDYPEILNEIIKQTSENFEKIGYVTLNKPYNTLIEIFKKNNVDLKKFGFVDAITKSVIKPESIKNCVFISAPNALTEMSIVIKKVSESQHPDIFIFDSLSSLLVYEKGPTLIKFVHSLVEFLRVHKIKIIFIALKSDIDSALIKDLSMFADKMIKTS